MNEIESTVSKCIISFEMFFPKGGEAILEGEFPKGEIEIMLTDKQFVYLDAFITREKTAILQKLERVNPELYHLISPPLNEAADKIMLLSNCVSNEYIIKRITKK